jgi:hypothetical protein
MTTLPFNIFGEKTIIVLLVAVIISNSLGVIVITNNSNEQATITKQALNIQAGITRSNVDLHSNQTLQALDLLIADKEQSDELLEPLLRNISETHDTSERVEKFLQEGVNQSATNQRQIENNQFLREILNILRNSTSVPENE